MVEQRLPAIDGDEGHWGEILNQFLSKEHYNTGVDNVANGGHKTVTIQAGTATAGTAPLKFTSGTLLATAEAGAIEFNSDKLYFTKTTGPTRQTVAAYDVTGSTGDIYYRDSSANFVRLAIGSTGDMLTVSSGLPAWSAAVPNTATVTVKDANFTIQDNTDTTKQVKFEASGIATATTRTLTVPNVNGTIVTTGDTGTVTNTMLAGSILLGKLDATAYSSTSTASTLAQRDANKNLFADNFIASFTTTATAAGTTTLTVASTQIQVFTGVTTQTVVLPTTSVAIGTQFHIINNSTGAVTVQSSGLNTITILAGNTSGIFTALVATPTTAANWDGQYWGTAVTNGKTLSVSNTLTFAGTDGTTMTFPGATDTVTTIAAAQILTNKTISGASNTLSNIGNASLTNSSVTINGSAVSLGGSTTVTANTTNALTFNNGGAGAASGTTFNGSAAQTISYNTIGASPLAGSASLTTTGTITSGTWSGSFGAVSGANLTNLTAGNLSGTIPSAVLGNSAHFIGTTSVALNRASANLALTGISSVQLPGATSGTVTLQPTATAGTTTITLPATTGTVITTGDTGTVTNTMLAGSIALAKLDATIYDTVPTASNLAQWDTSKNLSANAFIPGFRTQATAGATTTLTIADAQTQEFTGTLTQTVVLPTTSVVAGAQYTIVNNSTGAVTVQSSGLNTISTLATGRTATFTAVVATPTTAANWDSSYITAGDASTNTATSVVDEVALFADTTGKVLKRATTTGIAKLTSGVISAAVAGTDYAAPNQTMFIGTTSVAINRASANLALTGISSVALPGATSGTVTLTPAATAGATAITLPATSGTLITTGDTGTVTNTMLAGSIADTKLATISTAGKVANSATTATNANTASAIVARDASGNFSAGTITATLSGSATSATTATNLANGSAGTLPYQSGAGTTAMLAAGTSGQFLKSAGASAPSWSTLQMTDIPDAAFKKSVKAATTADLGTVTYANGTAGVGATITGPTGVSAVVFPAQDGITIALNDRILVKNQAAPAQNGIYTLTTVGVAGTTAWVLTRATDADTNSEIGSGSVAIDQGTTQGGDFWRTTFKATDTVGTTAMNWYEVVYNSGTWAINTTGSAATLTTPRTINGTSFNGSANITTTSWGTSRTLAGNAVDGSANVAFTNKFIVQGTADAGLSGAQFLGALGTGIVKNTTTTGVLSIAVAGTDYAAPNQTMFIGTTSVAINRASANLALTGISSVALPGATSGTVTLTPAATAGATAITLPATSGTLITTGDTGTVTNTMLAGSIANAKLANSAITIAGTSTSLGGSITQDTITGLASTGIVKRTGANTLAIAVAETDYVSPSGTGVLSNKEIATRVSSTTSSATPAINVDTTDEFDITALATAITSMTSGLTGAPSNGQKLMIRIKDAGTGPYAITWGASFISSGTAQLLTTTVAGKTHRNAFIYDSTAAAWVCVAVDWAGY